MKTMKLVGSFSDADLAEFMAVLRRIDEANPTGIYAVSITDPDSGSMDEAERSVLSLLPPLPDRATQFVRARYRDDSCPPRACNYCARTYRGPAVYCSFDCAMTDA